MFPRSSSASIIRGARRRCNGKKTGDSRRQKKPSVRIGMTRRSNLDICELIAELRLFRKEKLTFVLPSVPPPPSSPQLGIPLPPRPPRRSEGYRACSLRKPSRCFCFSANPADESTMCLDRARMRISSGTGWLNILKAVDRHISIYHFHLQLVVDFSAANTCYQLQARQLALRIDHARRFGLRLGLLATRIKSVSWH